MIVTLGSSDLFIFTGMLVTVVAGIFGSLAARLVAVKVGLMLAVVLVCLGLVNFGWFPLFGGTYGADVYFGSIMLALGGVTAVLLAAVDEAYRRLNPRPDARRGFPVTVGKDEREIGA